MKAYTYFLNGHDPGTNALVQKALDDMKASGLDPETLEMAGIRLNTDNGEVLNRLGFSSINGNSIVKTCILAEIPYFDKNGNVLCYEYRLYPPIKDRKYLRALGVPAYPYILPSVWDIADKRHKPIWITEGVKKVLKLIQHGRPCIGLSGVQNFKAGKDSEETESLLLWRELEAFSWKGRTVYIGFDSDLWTNPQVRVALFTLACTLIARGAGVMIPVWKGEKGIDDLLANEKNPDKTLLELEEKALPLEKFITLEHIDEIIPALSKTIASMDSLKREGLITRIAKSLHVKPSSLQNKLVNASQAVEDNILILHPAYEANETLLSLGFKETFVVDNMPSDRNIYILSHNGDIRITHENVNELDSKKIVFNVRDRVLITLNDRWNKAKIQEFIKDTVAPEGLYKEIKTVLMQYVEFINLSLYGLVAAWIIATYFFRLFYAFPFLSFLGKKQTGKSRALDLLERLSFSAFKTKGISIPSLADSIDGQRCTVLVDQAEILSQTQYLELSGILADSYTVGGGKRRVVDISKKSRRILEFETYSPKAFASTKDIDVDLKDRTIQIIMIRAEKEYPYPVAFLPIWQELRDKLYRLLLTRWPEVRQIYKTAGQDMVQRVRELWRPLDTILTLENVPDNERQAIKETFLESMQETQTGLTEPEETLFTALRAMLGDNVEGQFTVLEIVEKMAIPESEKFNKKAQTQWVGRTIKKLSLFSKYLGKKENRQHEYLFSKEKIENIYKRYNLMATMATMAKPAPDKDIQTAIENNSMANNGNEGQTIASNCHYPQNNGNIKPVDTSHSCQTVSIAIDLSEKEKNEIIQVPAGVRAW